MKAITDKSKKPLIIAGVIAMVFFAVAAAGLKAIRARQSKASVMPSHPLAVKTVVAKRGVIQQTIPALATVKSAATVQVKAETAGRIISIAFREGDKFKKGDVLAVIDGREQQAQLSAAQARSNVVDGQIAAMKAGIKALESQRQGVKSNFDFLKTELERYEKLFNANAISVSDIESYRNRRNDAESKLLSLDAQIQAQKAQLASLLAQKKASRKEVDLWKVRKDYTEIVAEFDGILTMRHQEEGNLVMPGSILFSVDDTSKFRLIMQLPQNAAEKVRLGQKVFSVEFPDAEMAVSRIYPAMNDLRQFVVEAATSKTFSQMKFDMQIPVSIIVKEVEGVVVDHTACFVNFTKPEEIYLFPISGKIARRVSLKPLLQNPEGDAVFAQDQLEPDTPLAAGSYLQNVRLPSSFTVEVLQ
ncbi:MAG: hypothetical protein Kow0029_25680 [Candidatus Rifleibacteriota bacterium]